MDYKMDEIRRAREIIYLTLNRGLTLWGFLKYLKLLLLLLL